jgi:glycosyltransferase involved in cell wall biosynthesis
LRQIEPDLVHFQGVTFLAAKCEQPNVLTIHGIVERDALWAGRRILRPFKWLLLKLTEEYGRRRVPYVILISEYVRSFLPKRNVIKKTWLVENPIADSYFCTKWQFEQARVFCCSKIVLRKNIAGMIKAFSLISTQFPHAQLRVAGTAAPDYLEKCNQIVRENRLQDNVHFLGNLSIEQVQYELSRANCLVLPSFQETAPLAIEEAMAVGVPVVGSRLCGIPDMIEEGKTGYLIDPYNVNDLAEAVKKILSDSSLAHSMSERAKTVARNRFKASCICEKTLQVYNEILREDYYA